MITYTKPDPVDWRELMRDLRQSGLATAQIADRMGCSPSGLRALGAVRCAGRASQQPKYPLGAALVALHKSRYPQ